MTATILEIATALKVSDRAIRKRAKQQDWTPTGEKVRGGGNIYALDSLPLSDAERKQVEKSLVNKKLDDAIEDVPEVVCALPTKTSTVIAEIQKKQLPAETSLAGWQRRTMEARLAILQYVDQGARVASVNKAVDRIVALAKDGELPEHIQQMVPIANARSGGDLGKQTLSRRTIFRWRSDLQSLGMVALAPREVVRNDMPAWGPALLKVWRQPQKPSLSEAVRQLRDNDIDVNYGQARRFLQKVGEVEKNKGRMGPKEIKAIKPFRRRDTSNLLPGDIYAADGHTFDAEVAHPDHGRPFRPEITMIIDVCTRMVTGWSVGLAESSLETLDALRMACEQIGPPAILYCDNGSGYKNQMMTAPGTGLMARLGIEMKHSIPYNSQARGIIERPHRSILVRTAKRLPTYIGDSMDRDAKQVAFKNTRSSGELLVEWPDFIRLVNAAIEEYHNAPHSGLPKFRDEEGRKRHYTPAEYWQLKAVKDMVVPANELPDLYHPQETRKVNRGEIRLYSNIYYSRDLEQWHGDEVLVAYNVHDAGKVWVRDQDQRLICIADLDGNKSDFMPKPVVEQGRDRRAAGRYKRLERKMEEIELERTGGQRSVDIEITPEQEEQRKALEIEMAEASNVVEIPTDDVGRYRLWCQMEKRIAQGEVLGDEEQRFFDAFRKSDYWRVSREIEQDLAIAK